MGKIMRILYVEDNPANLFLVKRVARMGGHEVINYIDGEDALANFIRDKPDLVLMDIQLAGELSGLDVVQRLRTIGHKTPIIAVTAYAMIGDRERFLTAGCDDYLAKPLPIPRLVELIEHYSKNVPVVDNVATRRIDPPIITMPIPGLTDPENIRSTTTVPKLDLAATEAKVEPEAATRTPATAEPEVESEKKDETPTETSRKEGEATPQPELKLEPLDMDAEQDTQAMPRPTLNPEQTSGELNGKH
ncbi:MAG: response regulator [Anaerolineae bacterium]|nr:response regulator [Anaerolineae bacterium]